MRSPSVSVVMPAYNRGRFLATAVGSVMAQSRPCHEIIVVDDGSTDDTADVVRSLGPRVRYLRQENAGPAAARNAGIRVATGDWVAFLDTDDRWLPEKIERQLAIVERHREVALVSADTAIADAAGSLLVDSNFRRHGLQGFFQGLAGAPIPNAPGRLLCVNFINTSTAMVRRDLLLALEGFDSRLRYGEDLELWLRVAASHPVACDPSVQEVRVEHATNVTRSIEPMLLGYVRMAEVIREWAAPHMRAWGREPDRYVADCLADLGYWYFSQGRFAQARSAMVQSLREAPSRRAATYALASLLPAPVVAVVRQLKQSVR
jgi:glycosyltransferase involved in cell wall biosynthesis